MADPHEARDARVRSRILSGLITDGRAPTAPEIAGEFRITQEEAADSYGRLAARRRLVLQPGGTEIHMIHPFSAVPTAFVVETRGRAYYGNCIWDALAVIGLLADSGRVSTFCGDGCGEAMTLTIEDGAPVDPHGVIHFQVPRAAWWDDIVFT